MKKLTRLILSTVLLSPLCASAVLNQEELRAARLAHFTRLASRDADGAAADSAAALPAVPHVEGGDGSASGDEEGGEGAAADSAAALPAVPHVEGGDGSASGDEEGVDVVAQQAAMLARFHRGARDEEGGEGAGGEAASAAASVHHVARSDASASGAEEGADGAVGVDEAGVRAPDAAYVERLVPTAAADPSDVEAIFSAGRGQVGLPHLTQDVENRAFGGDAEARNLVLMHALRDNEHAKGLAGVMGLLSEAEEAGGDGDAPDWGAAGRAPVPVAVPVPSECGWAVGGGFGGEAASAAASVPHVAGDDDSARLEMAREEQARIWAQITGERAAAMGVPVAPSADGFGDGSAATATAAWAPAGEPPAPAAAPAPSVEGENIPALLERAVLGDAGAAEQIRDLAATGNMAAIEAVVTLSAD